MMLQSLKNTYKIVSEITVLIRNRKVVYNTSFKTSRLGESKYK